jgi:hypothetical protein
VLNVSFGPAFLGCEKSAADVDAFTAADTAS